MHKKGAVLFGVFSKENELRVMKLCMLSLLDWFWFNRTRKRHMVHTQCSISLPSVPAAKTTTKLLAFFVPVNQKFTLPICSMLTAAVNDFSSWRSFLPGIYFLSTQPDLGSQPWQPACVKGHPINTFEFLEGDWHDFSKNLLMQFVRAKLVS